MEHAYGVSDTQNVSLHTGMVAHEENGLSRIFADDPIFSLGEAFAEELMLGPNPLKNFCRLAQGYRGFPLLILLNPCDRHTEDFGDMFTKDSALRWLKRSFSDIGLDLEYDVPILDMFPYLSDHWCRHNINAKHVETHELILRSCNITQKLVEILNPPAIVVMHCATNPHAVQRHPFFGGVQHPLAESLSSSMEKAVQGSTRTLNIGGREIPVIPAFHPSRINYETDLKEKKRLTVMLRGILSKVFGRFVDGSERTAQSGS